MTNLIFRLCFAILLVASTPMNAAASSAAHTKYSALAKKYDKMPSEKIMAAAQKLANAEDTDKAIVLYTLVGNRFNDDLPEKEKQQSVLAHVEAGKLYINCGDYIKALDIEVEGVKLSEQCKEQKYSSQLYNVIGSIYTYFLDYEKAINYYKKAHEYCRKYPDKKIEYKILANLTNLYININNIREAKKYYEKTERVRDRKENLYTFMSSYMQGLIEIKEGIYPKQINRYTQLAKYAKEKKLGPRFVCYAYQEMYIAYDRMHQPDSARKYLHVCYDEAKKHNVLFRFIATIKSLVNLYEELGDTKNANKYQSIYINIKDSLQNTRQFDMTKNKLFLYEVEKTTKEIEALHEKEQDRVRTIRVQWIVMGVVLLFTVCIAVFLTVVQKQKKQLYESYHSLFRQNKDNLNMQKKLEQLYKDNTAELNEKSEQIRKLQEELSSKQETEKQKEEKEQEKEKEEPKQKPTADETAEKYQTSNLNEEGRKIIERRIINVMEETTEFCSTDFSLDRLAELVGSNSKYVSQVINDSFKKNFNAFINTYRIQTARERLIDVENYGNFTIKGISESVGFKSPTTFINVFKKMVGLTPSMYQNMARKDEDSQETAV